MKTHLISSDDPLTSGSDRTALCGKTVSRAEFVFMFENGPSGIKGLSTLLFCNGCASQAFTKDSRRYLYGMVDGEQAKRLKGYE